MSLAILQGCSDPLLTPSFASTSHNAGHGEGAHHLHQQDGRLPGVPEQRLPQLRGHQRQKLRDERPGTQRGRRVCEYHATTRTGNTFCLPPPLTSSPPPSLQGEFPLPEQYKTIWDGDKFVTVASENIG